MRRWARPATALAAHLRPATCRKTRDVRMVPADDSATDVDDAGGVAGSVVELSAAEMSALPRTQRRVETRESCLSAEERRRLTQMIFDAHYASEGEGREDRAMWYQSALEVQWLEEWARDEGPREKDVIRRAIKKAVLERVDLKKPLAYIIGHQPFYGCQIRCSPPLLCPRPETEMWTHWFVNHHLLRAATLATEKTGAVDARPSLRVLDMCCGTGCIGIAIAVHAPHAEVVAVDVMDEAVKASEENAKLNGLCSGRYRVVKSDMFEAFYATDDDTRSEGIKVQGKPRLNECHVGSFDCIVSNPPYVLPEQYAKLPPGIKLWESKLALVGDVKREDRQYLYFQELCEVGAALLKPKAHRHAALTAAPNLVFEVGLQAERVASLMERSGLWEEVEVHLDYAQQMRWISARSSH